MKNQNTEKKPLTLADCVVRAARGYQRPDGMIVWSGMLWVRDQPVASFHNRGNGGCNSWDIRDRAAFDEFKALAVRQYPNDRFEQEDTLVGTLWDAATLKGAA